MRKLVFDKGWVGFWAGGNVALAAASLGHPSTLTLVNAAMGIVGLVHLFALYRGRHVS